MRIGNLVSACAASAFVMSGCAMSNAMVTDVAAGDCHPTPPIGAENIRIRWFEPVRPGDESTIHEWCGTVGPPVFEPTPRIAAQPKPSERDSLVAIAVATWNTHGGSGELLRFLDEQLALSCVEAGPPARGPDFAPFVLLIQEAFRASERVPEVDSGRLVPTRLSENPHEGPRLDIVEVAHRCGLALLYVPSMRNGYDETDGEREDRGNAILSTLELTDPIAIELPFEAQRRVAVGATVRIPGGDSLRVVSLHLDTSSSLLRTLGTGNSTRLRQGLGTVEALALAEGTRDVHILTQDEPPHEAPGASPETEDCERARAERHPIATLLAGDLNTWSDGQTVIQHLMCYFPGSPPLDGQSTRGIFPADHMFFRAGGSGRIEFETGSYELIADPYNSDHKARLGRLAIAETAESAARPAGSY